MDIHYLSLLEVSDRIRRRELTSVGVTEALLARIARHDERLHSIQMLLADPAIEQAKQADSEIESGFWRGPLHGIPIGIKDLHWTKGLPTTAGMEILRDFQPTEDATVVERLKRAGAVIIAKLHMTEGAMLDHHPSFPRPSNPWSDAHWPGISSSGSGIAVAAGFCYGATGTDTGGSIRLPSSANSLSGIKPTWGRVSRHGLIHLCESLDHIGPMARNVTDAAAMLQAIAGADHRDPTALSAPVPDYLALAGTGISDLTIGIDWKYSTDGIEPEIGDALRRAADILGDLGAMVREIEIPWNKTDVDAGMPVIFAAEAAAAHAGHFPRLADHYAPRNRALIERGLGLDAVTVARAYQARDRLKGMVASVFREVDLILTPGLGKIVPTWEAIDALFNEAASFGEDLTRFIFAFNLAGVPTLSFPGGFTSDGLPIGIQLIGPPLAEPSLIRAGTAFQTATDFHVRRPPLD